MFKYICMPKLVAYYLREFSLNKNDQTSTLYKFVFCLCLPFVSKQFREARLIALAIAECTDSEKQIVRLLSKITGTTITVSQVQGEYFIAFGAGADSPDFPYTTPGAVDNPLVPYTSTPGDLILNIQLNGASQSEVEAYIPLLIPFYIKLTINYT